jgi:hypothetical protein
MMAQGLKWSGLGMFVAVGWLAGCGPSAETAETDGDSEGTTSGTQGPATSANTGIPDPATSAGTGQATGDDTTSGPPPGTTSTGSDETTGGGEGDNCCEPHATPGCNEPEVETCVCEQQATCCALAWDEVCSALAQDRCAAECVDPGTTGDPTTGGVSDACLGVETFEMLPSEATLSGDWQLGMSMIGEGEIAVVGQMGGGTDGSVLFEPDIPCDDTWYIWVRAFDQGNNDSYFATLDGEPMPPAIFEGDCTAGGQGYDWAVLNWRDEAAAPCDYVEDPWAPDWAAGTHQIEFSYREATAMGRILLTNDPALVPM